MIFCLVDLICRRFGIVILVVTSFNVGIGYAFVSYHGEKKRGITYYVVKKYGTALWWEAVTPRLDYLHEFGIACEMYINRYV